MDKKERIYTIDDAFKVMHGIGFWCQLQVIAMILWMWLLLGGMVLIPIAFVLGFGTLILGWLGLI